MRDSASTLFSARWQTQVEVPTDVSGISFSSHASGGSRVKFDEVLVLDAVRFADLPVSTAIFHSPVQCLTRTMRWISLPASGMSSTGRRFRSVISALGPLHALRAISGSCRLHRISSQSCCLLPRRASLSQLA